MNFCCCLRKMPGFESLRFQLSNLLGDLPQRTAREIEPEVVERSSMTGD
jgi:hypothetical protein